VLVCFGLANAGYEWCEELLQWTEAHLPRTGTTLEAEAQAEHQTANTSCLSSAVEAAQRVAAALQVTDSISSLDSSAGSYTDPINRHVHPQKRVQQLFRGLRVRMSVATGVAERITLHKVTSRVEYPGSVTCKVQAMADAPEGGQVHVQCIYRYICCHSCPSINAIMCNVSGKIAAQCQ
jgi:hypothetical protein